MAGKFAKYLGGAISNGVSGTGKAVKKAAKPLRFIRDGAENTAVKVGKSMVRDTEPGISNLWTGKRESGNAIIAATIGAAGYTGYSAMKGTVLAPKQGTVTYGGTAPIMDADGVSSTSQAPTLGANGNMVFGLYNARKG